MTSRGGILSRHVSNHQVEMMIIEAKADAMMIPQAVMMAPVRSTKCTMATTVFGRLVTVLANFLST